MSDSSFSITYRLASLGALAGKNAGEMPLMDITNYSFEGELEIAADDGKITLVEAPLLEAFHAIRQILKIVPIFTRSSAYAQMFREARTVFTVEDDTICVEHHEIAALRARSGSERITGNYVAFCTSFRSAAKTFVRELRSISPSLFNDPKTVSHFSDLRIGNNIKDGDPAFYSIV